MIYTILFSYKAVGYLGSASCNIESFIIAFNNRNIAQFRCWIFDNKNYQWDPWCQELSIGTTGRIAIDIL